MSDSINQSLNFKNPKGGTEVKWHQDKPYFPHTNDSVLTIGVYLEDCDDLQGPLEIISGSHKKDVFSHYDQSKWIGNINDKDLSKIDLSKKKSLKGKADQLPVITIEQFMVLNLTTPITSRPLNALCFELRRFSSIYSPAIKIKI